MSTYDDLMRSLLVERFTPVPAPPEPQASDRLTELVDALRAERRRTPRRQTPSTNIIESPRRTS